MQNPELLFKHLYSSVVNNNSHLYINLNRVIQQVCRKHGDGSSCNEQIITGIIKYIKHIINTINPSKSVYIATDGIVPQTKLVKHRERFLKKGACTNEFNSSHISPGTVFMENLSKRIKSCINMNVFGFRWNTIVFSNHRVPTECEVKILDHIQKNIEPVGDSIAIYGFDPNLLTVSFKSSCCETIVMCTENEQNDIIYLPIISCCCDIVVNKLNKNINIVNKPSILIDFVLISILVGGNDVLPRIGCAKLMENGWGPLFQAYADTGMPLIDNARNIIWGNFNMFISFLSVREGVLLSLDNGDDDYVRLYYETMFGEYSEKFVESVCEQFIACIIWYWEYYVKGHVISWNFYYKFHAPPLMVDITRFIPGKLNKAYGICKVPGNKSTPFEQLLCVTPKDDACMLPKALQLFMENPCSPTEDWYLEHDIYVSKTICDATESYLTPDEIERNTEDVPYNFRK